MRRWPKTVLDIDDLPSRYQKSELKSAKSLTDRLLTMRRFWLWKRRERRLLQRFTLLGVCSKDDRDYLGGDERIHVIPNGFEPPATITPRSPASPPRVGFIGLLRYAPNRDGVEWFAARVWPEIKKACPAARFRLVGSGSDVEAPRLGADIDGLGWVADASAEIATWSLMIVPIRIGGGTRIKIAEGFSRKCPVVATPWGAFGYDVESGQEILLADKPAEFARACLSILQDPRRGEEMAARAWARYTTHWTWDAIEPRVAAAVEHGVRCSRSTGIPAPSSSPPAELAST
jgi:glycosyltransferase involved in cell wall biosynthesis